jgi:fatty acid-binding protein DegV
VKARNLGTVALLALVGSMLSIKPIIGVSDGAVTAEGKVRTRSKAVRHLVEKVTASTVACGNSLRSTFRKADLPERERARIIGSRR